MVVGLLKVLVVAVGGADSIEAAVVAIEADLDDVALVVAEGF